MIQTVNFNQFVDAFERHNRAQQLGGYYGLRALFDYLEDYEDAIGEQVELDVIGLCSEWSYYESVEELLEDQGIEYEVLQEYGLIDVPYGGFLVLNFQ